MFSIHGQPQGVIPWSGHRPLRRKTFIESPRAFAPDLRNASSTQSDSSPLSPGMMFGGGSRSGHSGGCPSSFFSLFENFFTGFP